MTTHAESSIKECNAGSVHQSRDGTIFIKWYDRTTRNRYKIYRDRRDQKFQTKKQAQKTLYQIQGDVERDVFHIYAYVTRESDVVGYMTAWLDTVKGTLSPSSYQNYTGYIRNHLAPFFKEKPIMLHEIRLRHITQLLDSLVPVSGIGDLSGKTKLCIIGCLRTCLDYAWRNESIDMVPPFPHRSKYGIQDPEIRWLPSDRQENVMSYIPEEHQPIFQWLKFHVRRPSEAISLLQEDFSDGVFSVQRSISARRVVDRTKTSKIYQTPMVSGFKQFFTDWGKTSRGSQFMFQNRNSRLPGRRYSSDSMGRIWRKACALAGEDIDMYSGLRHSRCSQFYNEMGYSLAEVQELADHANMASTRRYTQTSVARKRELLEGKVIPFRGQRWSESGQSQNSGP